MKLENGINEKYAKQCIEANRHNAVTSYYYLLMKMKQIEGDNLDEEENSNVEGSKEQVITAGS